MPEEILAIVLISIAAGTAMSIVRMVLGYRERRGMRGTTKGSSLTTSELEIMMRRAVEEATAPLMQKLVKKMEDLEFELARKKDVRQEQDVRQLHEARTDLLLDVDSDELEATAEPVSRKSQTRT